MRRLCKAVCKAVCVVATLGWLALWSGVDWALVAALVVLFALGGGLGGQG